MTQASREAASSVTETKARTVGHSVTLSNVDGSGPAIHFREDQTHAYFRPLDSIVFFTRIAATDLPYTESAAALLGRRLSPSVIF
jgi:hypothetical protein